MSTLKYLEGRYNRASGTRNAFGALSDDLVAEGYPPMVVNSGDREPQDQIDIFLSKFVPSSGPRDVGPYNDRRYWPGHGWWKRVVGGGTVGVPDTSNHEKRRANDLQYPYNSNTAAHRRAQVLAKRHNITCEGMSFAEFWHWTYWGALGTIGGSSAGASTAHPYVDPDLSEEDDMKFLYVDDDGNGRPFWTLLNTKTGRFVTPIYDQKRANGWATVWGNSRSVTRQEFLNAIDAIQKTG